MTTIIDLPDVPQFTIKKVALQTGIHPVTLRAWERRHEVLNPHRAGNRYRLYSERDVAIVMWLKNRIREGISISEAVNELHSLTRSNAWPKVIPAAPAHGSAQAVSDLLPSHVANQLYTALIKQDENQVGSLLREAHARFDLIVVFQEVLVPALQRINDAWYWARIQTSTKHFATVYLRAKLISLLQAYSSNRGAPLVLIACAPMEHSELENLMLAVLLCSAGYRVEYLGPDISIEDLADYAGYENPRLVILSAASESSAREMRRMQDLLKKQRSKALFGYSGLAFDTSPKLRQEIPGIYLGSTLELALKNVNQLI